MSYTSKFTGEQIDAGIEKAIKLPPITANDFGKQLFVNEDGSGFLLIGNTHEEKWNLCDLAESVEEGKWEIGNRNPSTGTGQFNTYYYMPVKGQVTYYIGEIAATEQKYARCVNWYDKDKTFLSCTETVSTTTITSPLKAQFCTISFYKSSPSVFLTTIENPEDRIDKVINDSIKKNDNKWNLLEKCEGFEDKRYVNGETLGTGPSFYTYYNIPVVPKTKYYYSCNGFVAANSSQTYGCRFINWYDKDKALLSTASYGYGGATSPVNAYYCTITFLTSAGYQEYTTREETEQYDEPFFTTIEDSALRVDGEVTWTLINQGSGTGVSDEQLEKIETSYEKTQDLDNFKSWTRMGFVQRARKGYVNFQFDDNPVAGDTAVKEVFDSYGYKCDFAIVSKAAADTLEVYKQFEKEGFGILSHSTDGVGYGTPSDDTVRQTQIAKMKTSYDTLTAAGFNIRGWVTPSSSCHADYYEPLSKIYDYGFGAGSLYNPSSKIHYFGTVTHIEQMPRVGIESLINKKVNSSTGDLQTAVQTYLKTFWGVDALTTDITNELVTVSNVPFETIVSNAIAEGYATAAVEADALNANAIAYLNEVWELSTDATTLVLGSGVATLMPTFTKASYRKGMNDIKTYINNAYTTNGLLVFYSHNSGYINTNVHGWGEAALVEILDYCKELGVAVATAADAIQDIFAFRYTDFLELKSSITT